MKRLNQRSMIFAAAFSAAISAWGQNPPPAPPDYPQQPPYNGQPAPYPQQPPYNGQPAPYPQQPPCAGQPPAYGAQPPYYAPQQLDAMVGRVALYPDPLLVEVLTASTFSNQIPDAAGWARAHAYLTGGALADAIRQDSLPWDPSVIGLLPVPRVLDVLAGDMGWTQDLGDAVLANRSAVMDAVQRERALALSYGYLRSGPEVRVVNAGPGDIEIQPVDPGFVYVPYYNPYVVYARPRPGFFVGGAITFGPRIVIGSFLPWGWGGAAFGWREHRIVINNHLWERAWVNRGSYVHPYAVQRGPVVDHRVERHELHEYRAPQRREREEHRDERR